MIVAFECFWSDLTRFWLGAFFSCLWFGCTGCNDAGERAGETTWMHIFSLQNPSCSRGDLWILWMTFGWLHWCGCLFFFFARLRGRDDPEALHGRLTTEGSRANGTYTARQLLNAGAPNLQRITMCHGCQAKKKVMQGGLSFELIFRNIEWRFDEVYDEFIWIL